MPGEHDLPRTGTDADFIDRLADYVETFRPGWSQRVRGADEAEIAELERLSGARHPDTYRRWLAFCGHDDDGVYLALRSRIVLADSGTVYADSWEKLCSSTPCSSAARRRSRVADGRRALVRQRDPRRRGWWGARRRVQ